MVVSDVCPRCLFLHLNLKDNDLLRRPEPEMKRILSERWPSLVEEEKKDQDDLKPVDFCHSCLGMIQDSFLNSCAEKIINTVKTEEYLCTNFRLLISQPVQLLLFGKHTLNEYGSALSAHRRSGNGLEAKDIMKIVLEPMLEKALSLTALTKIAAELEIIVTIKHPESEVSLFPKIEKQAPQCFVNAKKHLYQATKKRAREDLSIYNLTTVTKAVDCLLPKDLANMMERDYFHHSVVISKINTMRAPIFFAGRYCKYSRELSQTPWILDGERKSEMSVEEFIALPVKKQVRADGYNFASSGREDIDVRMLGVGRPFLLELVNAREIPPATEIAKLQDEINKSTSLIQVRDLQVVNKEEAKRLKDGEEDKTKSYSAICCTKLSTPLEDSKFNLIQKLKEMSLLRDLKVEQKTPLRVLHRRNLAVRARMIYDLKAEEISTSEASRFISMPSFIPEEYIFFQLDMTTQAGTYVKEFVHGDFGRTVPNVGTLIGQGETDILSLDVTAVNLDWPRSLS